MNERNYTEKHKITQEEENRMFDIIGEFKKCEFKVDKLRHFCFSDKKFEKDLRKAMCEASLFWQKYSFLVKRINYEPERKIDIKVKDWLKKSKELEE